MPEGTHPMPELDDHTEECSVCGRFVVRGILPTKGWSGLPMVDMDGKAWPLSFAAKYLEVSEEFLRVAVKELEVEPDGVIAASAFRRSGRQPRAYNARTLVIIAEGLENIRQELGLQDPSA